MVDQHPIILRGLNVTGLPDAGAIRPPTLLERRDQAFVEALLAELGDAGRPLARLATQRPDGTDPGGGAMLFQPVHRIFNLALFEAVCDRFGEPRLDPAEILDAGLVVRRRAAGGALQGWATAGQAIRGWVNLADRPELAIDPDPAFRPPRLNAGEPSINRLLALQNGGPPEPFSEQVSPLFVAPPEVCRARGKTILYGLVPVASSEYSEVPALPPLSGAARTAFENQFRAHLSHYFKQGPALSLPEGDRTLDFSAADTLTYTAWEAFLTTLRQAAVELGAFGENPALRDLLNTLQVIYAGGQTEPAGDFLERAAGIFIEREGSDEADPARRPLITMPTTWPAIGEALATALYANALARVESKAAELSAGEPRFAAPGRTYVVQGFVRLRRPAGCPPVTAWSTPTPPFSIAPWFEPKEGLPPVQVPLPDLSDRSRLKQLKPNVAFQVPEALFNLLQNSPDDFLDGKAKEKAGVALDWICGFNIPIITLCAFIVLNIFLSLFDLIFRWLMFIKICIPIPKQT